MPLIILAVLLCIVSVSSSTLILSSLAVGRGCSGARDCQPCAISRVQPLARLATRQNMPGFVALCIASGQMLMDMPEHASDTFCKRRGCCEERSCRPRMRRPTSS